ncbi:phage baseplate assembly protein [Terasakiella sp. A23]|uniref:phage baseplate assembly protein domain-containing protein n=1 Tax=Terasakiella sp. FCG-A23 TaxID=3080561 RepID=UPI0029530B54|nr:phage baseplate assembly protein [Terasakiella sp. A23]MDV7340966.1 phage baseplate assembly protein [Terasakiella sp. A23]
MLPEWIREPLDDIKNRIRALISRGEVTHVYKKDADQIRRIQVSGLYGDGSDKIELFEQFGLTSYPLSSAKSFLVSLLGQRSHLFALVCDPRKQPDCEAGEVILWSPYGQRIHLKKDGGMDITAPKYINILSDDIIVKANKKLRLEGDEVEVYAKTSFAWDVNGHGQTWHTNYVDSWTIGQISGTTYNILPTTYLGRDEEWTLP